MRSLHGMIENCSASMQKSLQGLDNTTAEGVKAFEQIVTALESHNVDVSTLKTQLKTGKRYLKADFKTHVRREEQCTYHRTVHALSNVDSSAFTEESNYQHNYECERCEILEKVLKEIAEILDRTDMAEQERATLKFELSENVRRIKALKVHLLRSSNQDYAKQDVLQMLDEKSCLVIMNWAMKFLPLQYREQMSGFWIKRQ